MHSQRPNTTEETLQCPESFLQVVFSTSVNCFWCGNFLLSYGFLALLDFVSRATVRPSSVRILKFLRNRFMDPNQILWGATYPPYLQTFFSVFFKILTFQIFTIFFRIDVNSRRHQRTLSEIELSTRLHGSSSEN